jgi:hypothetical protein
VLGDEHFIHVRQPGVKAALVRFDLSSVPPYSVINDATLRLYVVDRSNWRSLDIELYRVRRDWSETQATWEKADVGDSWASDGCNGVGTDRDGEILASVVLPDPESWVELDVTELVSAWMAEPADNYGVFLRGGGSVSVGYVFISFEHPDVDLRPMLRVDFGEPAASPTPTASPTDTASPTPTHTMTPTVTPTDTLTPTSTLTPAAISTPTMEATSSPTPSLIPSPSATQVAYVDADADACLNSWAPNTNQGYSAFLDLRTFGYKAPVVHFSLDGVPSNALVQRATLRLRTVGSAGNSLNVKVVGLARHWVESGVTWNAPLSGEQWTSPGASAPGSDRLEEVVASAVVSGGDQWWEWDVTTLVRGWISEDVPNHGLMLFCDDANVHAEHSFTSREYGTPAQLVIEYAVIPTYEDYVLQLYAGLNMVSLPVQPDNDSIEALLAPMSDSLIRVWAYDASDLEDPWMLYEPGGANNRLDVVRLGEAYWFEMAADATITLRGIEHPSAVIPLYNGWNFVGYPSLTERDLLSVFGDTMGVVQLIWHYDAEDKADPWKRYSPGMPPSANDLTRLKPGTGYWVMTAADAELTIP